ncbi:MAG: phosphoenolpyruvate synthase [Microgenomates group bacterium]
MPNQYIKWFSQIDKHDVAIVGGKGANLGEMFQAGFPVPYGFVVTAQSFFCFIEENNLEAKILHMLSTLNYENPKELSDVAGDIRKLILKSPIPNKLVSEILDHYEKLEIEESKQYKNKSGISHVLTRLKHVYDSPLVAVRSSATAEDLPDASFAGQQETYLNVKGENHLIQKIREAWASLYTERACYYRHAQKYDHIRVGLAAVVQRMVQSEKSGIAFSIDPVTNNKSVITIEAIYGLGEYIVQGQVTPDHYEVDKKTFSIIKNQIKTQKVQFVKKRVENVELAIPKSEGEKQKITDEQIIALAKVVAKIENHYFFPQDIEWAIEGNSIYIVQSRPITTMNEHIAQNTSTSPKQRLLVKGDPASPGIRSGRPVVINSPKEIDKIKKGDVLVAMHTNPDYVPAMKKAAGIITETGGRTSHAAIVSRELGVPAVVGAENATSLLRHEKFVTVNGGTGEVFRGNALISDEHDDSENAPKVKHHTLTHVYVNMAEADQAHKVAQMHVDGIGLLRAEFMIADMGTHPRVYIHEGREKEFINKLAAKLTIFAKEFSPRPVVYRATDFKTNEYKNLKGGAQYEQHEENPMIGFRGASRYLADKKVFAMELDAIKKVRDAGYKNINLMIPFVRNPQEIREIKQFLSDQGFDNLPSFKLWAMIEVPSAVIMLDEILDAGIDGISVGTNDLTMLLMGVDRDNQEIAYLYDERSPAVLWALEKIVKTARKHGVTVSVCGQAPSDYPELVEKLVGWGVTSLSLNPDAVDRTRELIFNIEKKMKRT